MHEERNAAQEFSHAMSRQGDAAHQERIAMQN